MRMYECEKGIKGFMDGVGGNKACISLGCLLG